jgi:diguanylate cyclase (GGDEF)-like protein
MKANPPVVHLVQIGLAAVIALLLLVGAIAYRSVSAATASAREVEHTGEVLEQLAVMRAAMESIESGYQDFALSGDDVYLQSSHASLGLLASQQAALRALTTDNASQQQRLADLSDLSQRMIRRGDGLVQVRRSQGATPALEIMRQGQNDPALDQFRTIATAMQAEERRRMSNRTGGEQRRYFLSRQALAVGSVLAILIAVLSGWIVLRDLQGRGRAEDELRRLNRLYAMFSAINALGLKVHDRAHLFSSSCRIAVEAGEFMMAWIGMVDGSGSNLLPVAWAGTDDEAVATIKAYFSTSAGALRGKTIAARVIRERAAVVTNDVRKDTAPVFGAMHARAGIRSIAGLPLLVSDAAIGVFMLYTSKPEFFDAAGMRLLSELAANVAFAIGYIEKQERLDRFAYYDALTGLANRSLFIDRLSQHVRTAAAAGHKLAVFLVDLERFRKFNDSLGRPAGDALLKQVAEWLAQTAGNVNLVSRVGADQFALVMPEVTYEADVLSFLEVKSAAFLNHAFRVNNVVYRIAAKVGVVLYPDDGADADTLFKNAEAAVKKAKVSGDRFLFYAQKMNETVPGSLGIENRLRQALDKEQFVLHYQPKWNLASGELTGAEALIRWNDPHSGLVAPVNFVSILETTGLIHEVGRWALHKAISDYQRWRRAGLPAVRIAVNVSPMQLRNRRFVAQVEEAVGITRDAACGLELELTESLIMEDVNRSIVSLQAIRALGVTIAIDDFGTGFSSLSYLAKLPVDTLKIDRLFVDDMVSDTGNVTLVSVIINLAHALRLNVVAEGVETEEQLRQLRLLRCDEVQGFLYGKPVPVEVFEQKYLVGTAAALV